MLRSRVLVDQLIPNFSRQASIENGREGKRAKNESEKSYRPRFRKRKLREDDHFLIISEWQHYALLSLMNTVDYRDDYHWIAKRLGISPSTVRISIDRLLACGLVVDTGDCLRPAQSVLETSRDVPSNALQAAHESTLKRAAECLKAIDVASRYFGSNTFAVKPEDIPTIKERLRKFMREIAEDYELSTSSEVYEMAIQFIPLTKSRMTHGQH